ncbi:MULTISPECIES: hypothetical protein [Desulfovibrio]|uniref:hypothetical protein n=1 Tax=Desulfovibrio TaxID=872 RepID=UPI001160A6AB|nr:MULTISPECIES: hypothetical protein [Desulfovibrio]
MKKYFLLILIFAFSSFLIVGCNSTSKEDLYGWWKPEKTTLMNNKCIYISEKIFKDSKEHQIIQWDKKEDSFVISFDGITAILNINKEGILTITPQVFGGGRYTGSSGFSVGS